MIKLRCTVSKTSIKSYTFLSSMLIQAVDSMGFQNTDFRFYALIMEDDSPNM